MIGRFVLDASVTACWAFRDESDSRADAAHMRLYEADAIVPAIWWYEVRNTLVAAERRGRIQEIESDEFRITLARLPISIEREVSENDLMRLARTYGLSFYDAAYLEMALRTGSDLATLDKALIRAAHETHVPLVA